MTIGEEEQKNNFDALFQQYYAPFCLYSHRYIEDEELCKDIVSDVFASLWSRRNDFELRDDTTIAYIKICVHNACVNALKHKAYEWDYESYCKANPPVYEETPDSVYTLDEMYEMLYETLDKLPPSYREVFMRSFFEGKTRNEIAAELDISVKTVNRYKAKALELLKAELKDSFVLLSFLYILTH
jgi:RNA polymerase sigma-70 factor (family 1)